MYLDGSKSRKNDELSATELADLGNVHIYDRYRALKSAPELSNRDYRERSAPGHFQQPFMWNRVGKVVK